MASVGESAIREHKAQVTEHVDPLELEEWKRFVDSGLPQLIANHNLVHTLFAFVDSGMAQRLGEGPANVKHIAGDGDVALASALLRYLEIRGVVSITPANELWSLTERGRAFMSQLGIAQLGFYREAYGPVFTNLSGLLTRELTYPADVARDGEALGRHSADGFHHFGTGVLLRALDSLQVKSFADLGCGAAGFLIDACKLRPEMTGIGVDLSPEALEHARAQVAKAGMSNRIQLFVGNAFTPEQWPEVCRNAGAIVTVGTLHEQFRDGEDAVLALLAKYAELMRGDRPMKGMVLGEPELHYGSEDADFFLVHVATLQGMPREREGWLRVIERSALRCDEVFVAPNVGPRFSYYVLRPR